MMALSRHPKTNAAPDCHPSEATGDGEETKPPIDDLFIERLQFALGFLALVTTAV